MPETRTPPELREAVSQDVNFEKCQMGRIIESLCDGREIEVESFSPYISDHNTATGELLRNNLPNHDKIGIAIAKMLRQEFQNARVISLYDEYNTDMPSSANIYGAPTASGEQIVLPEETRNRFRDSIEKLMRDEDIIREGDNEGEDYFLVSESSKQEQAQTLVDRLSDIGAIREEKNGEIWFDNNSDEFLLRTKAGRWMCEALDASAFLDPSNLETTHLVVLPNHFKDQQDRVWAMLRALGHEPDHYHNIYFDPEGDPEEITRSIQEKIHEAKVSA